MNRAEEILKEMEENLEKNKGLAKEYKELREKSDSPYWSLGEMKIDEVRYFNAGGERVDAYMFRDDDLDDIMVRSANAFKDEDYAQFISNQQNLIREMDKFSKENGGNEIDWEDRYQQKYVVFYNHADKEVQWVSVTDRRDIGGVYFISGEIAQKAIDKFGDRIKELYSRGY